MQGSSARAPDVAIIGGGIVGTAAAAFLAEAGARVVLVEREGLASGASGANSGVVQHPFDPILAELYRTTLSLYRELAVGSASFHLATEPAGMLFVSTDEAGVRRFRGSIGAAFPGLATEILSGVELERVEPALATGLWACRVDVGYPVMPAASTYGYATLAEARGAEIRQGRAAVVELDGDRAVGIRIDGRSLPAGQVLVAAGPWTPEVLDPSGAWAPITPRWGVVVEAELASPPHHVLEEAGIDAAIGTPSAGRAAPDGDLRSSGDGGAPGPGGPGPVGPGPGGPGPGGPAPHEVDFSLVPLPGASAVGSTFLEREPDPAAWIELILLGATRFVPAVADAPIRGTRACARPQSVDGLPLIGAVAGRRGLYVCAGHGPWGISTGPGSARLVVDLILGRAPSIPADLDPGRFGTPGAP
jgi:glycine/D-amino acid oxidase-like deaminating enzyme